jgi:SRSO17 transposase
MGRRGQVLSGTVYWSKTELTLEEVDQARVWGLPSLPVLADSTYGDDFSLRQALRERQLQYIDNWLIW